MRFWDNKTGWKEGVTKADVFMKTVQNEQPSELWGLDGVDPKRRTEVNFKIVSDKPVSCVFGGKKICQFVFTVPAKDANDKSVSKALQILGWLPEAGKFKHQYLVKIPKGTAFACDGGDFKPGDTKEVAFPVEVPYEWILAASKIDSKGAGTDAPLGPFKGDKGKLKKML
jgi:hypothetical protein